MPLDNSIPKNTQERKLTVMRLSKSLFQRTVHSVCEFAIARSIEIKSNIIIVYFIHRNSFVQQQIWFWWWSH